MCNPAIETRQVDRGRGWCVSASRCCCLHGRSSTVDGQAGQDQRSAPRSTNSCTCRSCLITDLRSDHKPRLLHHSKGRNRVLGVFRWICTHSGTQRACVFAALCRVSRVVGPRRCTGRVTITLPWALRQSIQARADEEGRGLSNLLSHLLEVSMNDRPSE